MAEVWTELLGCHEMDRVERSQVRRHQDRGRVESSVVDSGQIDESQYGSASSDAFFAFKEQGAERFSAGERTRHKRSESSQVPPQRRRLWLFDRQFHQR